MEINYGLKLPFRFYDALDKQARYRGCGRYSSADEIRHNEYLIAYGCRLLPFQIIRATDPSTTTNLSIVSICDDTETDLTAFVDSGEWVIETIGEFDYITFLSVKDIENVGCAIAEGIYYAKFNDGTNTWYSEEFEVVQSGFTEQNYRIWSKAPTSLREWSSGEYRIVKN